MNGEKDERNEEEERRVVKGADQKVDVEMKGKKDEEGRGVKRV